MRLAGLNDLPVFEQMLRAYLAEQEDAGSPVRLTRRTVDWYRDLARAYVRGSLFGVLVLSEVEGPVGPQPVGFALAGEDLGEPRVDTMLGRTAVVWLTWVAPAHRKDGRALDMLIWGRPTLLEQGFEVASMSVREDNTQGHALCLAFGAEPVERLYRFPLKEEPRGRPKQ